MELINLSDYEAPAKARLDQATWDFYMGGSDDEVTLRANRSAFERIRLRPRMLVDVSACQTQTTVLGIPIQMPIMVAPTSHHGLAHPEAECATARGTGQAGTLLVVSTESSRPLEAIAEAASGPLWFQLYPRRVDQVTARLLHRAESAGYRAVVLTVDVQRLGRREKDLRNRFVWPSAGNFTADESGGEKLSLTWKDIAWLRTLTSLPLLLKGILTAEDARIALEHGVDGIVVSNHGGRQLDGAFASIDALPEIVEAVAGRCEVYLDGGIRRGTDVLKALAIGARAVLVGRPILLGLAVDGADGVAHVLALLRAEFELAMALCGRPTVESIDRSLLCWQ